MRLSERMALAIRRHPFLYVAGLLLLGLALGFVIDAIWPPLVFVVILAAFAWCVRELLWLRRTRRRMNESFEELRREAGG